MKMTPSEIGARAEIAVMGALANAGIGVLIPFGSHHRFDLAFEHGGRLVKVQCKTGRPKNGVVAFWTCNSTRSGQRRDYRDDVDLFGVYCHERSEVYLVPVEDVPNVYAHLRVAAPRNNQKAGTRMADQYLVRDGRLPDAVLQRFTQAGNRLASNRRNPSDDQLILTDIDISARMRPMASTEIELPVLCCAPLAAPTFSEDEARSTADLFKALADSHRVRIINLLANANEPVCVCDIQARIGLSQPTTSFHLKKLVVAGLLQREQKGTWAYYSLDDDAMARLMDVVRPKGEQP